MKRYKRYLKYSWFEMLTVSFWVWLLYMSNDKLMISLSAINMTLSFLNLAKRIKTLNFKEEI